MASMKNAVPSHENGSPMMGPACSMKRRPEQAELEREHRAGHRADREKHGHALGPGLGELPRQRLTRPCASGRRRSPSATAWSCRCRQTRCESRARCPSAVAPREDRSPLNPGAKPCRVKARPRFVMASRGARRLRRLLRLSRDEVRCAARCEDIRVRSDSPRARRDIVAIRGVAQAGAPGRAAALARRSLAGVFLRFGEPSRLVW